MDLTGAVEIPKRTMVLFFVVDTSGSMEGSKIGEVNTAIEEVIPDLMKISAENSDAQIKVAALEFSSGARWLTPNGPMELEQFHWNRLEAAGVTDLGMACKELNEKLSTKAFMKDIVGYYAPAIFLMSDGEPTDDWRGGLEILKQNKWFKAAVKVAVAISDEANRDVLAEFTGTKEAVIVAHQGTLGKMIKFVSVSASKIASKSASAGAGDEQKQAELNAAIQEEIADLPDSTGDAW